METRRVAAVFAGRRERMEAVFKGWSKTSLAERLVLPADPLGQSLNEETEPGDLSAVEVILGTWGMPVLSASLLDRMPSLRAVFYAAGSVRPFVTSASWERGIRVFSSAHANALPVAEFTFAQILLSLKAVPRIRVRDREGWLAAETYKRAISGNFDVRVGLVSYGLIARRVRALLRACDHEVLVYDPFLTEEEAAREGVTLAGLETLFARCEVVSLHTPLLPATLGLIREKHLASMKPGATFINTARGAVVHQGELAAVLRRRPDLTAILDVLEEEPPPATDPLLGLSNAWIYPHLAGAIGNEYQRFLHALSEALGAYLSGQSSPCEIFAGDLDRIA